jgi:hypothetical protein
VQTVALWDSEMQPEAEELPVPEADIENKLAVAQADAGGEKEEKEADADRESEADKEGQPDAVGDKEEAAVSEGALAEADAEWHAETVYEPVSLKGGGFVGDTLGDMEKLAVPETQLAEAETEDVGDCENDTVSVRERVIVAVPEASSDAECVGEALQENIAEGVAAADGEPKDAEGEMLRAPLSEGASLVEGTGDGDWEVEAQREVVAVTHADTEAPPVGDAIAEKDNWEAVAETVEDTELEKHPLVLGEADGHADTERERVAVAHAEVLGEREGVREGEELTEAQRDPEKVTVTVVDAVVLALLTREAV